MNCQGIIFFTGIGKSGFVAKKARGADTPPMPTTMV